MPAVVDVELEFDRPDRRYAAGETIRGVVHLHTRGRVEGGRVSTRLNWSTHGRGNRQTGLPQVAELFHGHWGSGTHSHGFEVQAPRSPLSYRGHSFNLDWYLEVAVLGLGGVYVVRKQDVIIGPPASEAIGARPALRGESTAVPTFLGHVLALAGLALLALLAIAVAWQGPGSFVIMGCLVAWVGVPAAVRVFRSVFGPMRIDMSAPALEMVAPDEESDGWVLEVTAGFEASSSVSGVRASIVGEEVTVSGHGTARRSDVHVFHSARQTNAGCRPGRRETFFSLPLPDDVRGRGSLDLLHNTVRWRLEIHFDVPGWPDHVQQQTLHVGF